LHGDLPALDEIAFEVAAAHDGRAGGEGGAAGVDEAAAGAADAGRVGEDDLGAAAGDFEVAREPAGTGGEDFVEDDARRAGGQIGVALYPAAQLGPGVAAGVVEDGPAGVDVELGVAVVREAGSTRALDVDQRHAVGGGTHLRLRGGNGFVSDDLGAGVRRKADQAEGGADHSKGKSQWGQDGVGWAGGGHGRVEKRVGRQDERLIWPGSRQRQFISGTSGAADF